MRMNVIRHNCCKEGKFEFTEIYVRQEKPDRIKCLTCGRIWEDVKEAEDEK